MSILGAIKTAGTAKKIGMAAGVLILIGLTAFAITKFIAANNEGHKQLGASEERARSFEGVLEDVKITNEAVEDLRRNPDTAYDSCVQHSRTPENC